MILRLGELTGNFDIVTGLNATRVGADAVSAESVGECLYLWPGDSFAPRRIAEEGTYCLGAVVLTCTKASQHMYRATFHHEKRASKSTYLEGHRRGVGVPDSKDLRNLHSKGP